MILKAKLSQAIHKLGSTDVMEIIFLQIGLRRVGVEVANKNFANFCLSIFHFRLTRASPTFNALHYALSSEHSMQL